MMTADNEETLRKIHSTRGYLVCRSDRQRELGEIAPAHMPNDTRFVVIAESNHNEFVQQCAGTTLDPRPVDGYPFYYRVEAAD